MMLPTFKLARWILYVYFLSLSDKINQSMNQIHKIFGGTDHFVKEYVIRIVSFGCSFDNLELYTIG